MDEELNHLGTAIFWLYILAALAFTSIILKTLYDMHPGRQTLDASRKRHVTWFSILAAVSFAALSTNMLSVLIRSYTLWARERGLSPADASVESIWHWSITSTLFEDFGNAIVASSARYLWVEASLMITLYVCLYVGIEGQHRGIPRLWAFIGLSQILPISFTQSLFYIALLLQPQHPTQGPWRVSRNAVVLLSGTYCACLAIAQPAGRTPWLIPLILLARGLLLAMQLYPWTSASAQENDTATPGDAFMSKTDVFYHLITLTWLCGFFQTGLNLWEGKPWGIAPAALSNPAVTTFSFDFNLAAISFFLWRYVTRDNATSVNTEK